MTRVLVVGAGLSGLATAWYLVDAGCAVRVVDARPSPGGLIHTTRLQEGLVETAANAFVSTPEVERLLAVLDLPPVRPRPVSTRRFIFRDGRARRWPLTFVETAEFGARVASAFVTRQARHRADETLDAWGQRVLGRPATNWLIAPAVQGIYATLPVDLSTEAIFRRRRRRTSRLVAPAGGMGALIERLCERLTSRGVEFEFNRRITSLVPGEPVVVCTDAPPAAALLTPHAPRLAAAVGRVRMTSLVTCTAFFAPHARDLHGFGILFPAQEGFHARGVLFPGDIFEGRTTLRAETWIYAGRSLDELPTSESLPAAIRADRARLGGTGDPIRTLTTFWPGALPVYGAPIVHVMDRIAELPPWLRVAGNYLGRIGVAGLLDSAREAAEGLQH